MKDDEIEDLFAWGWGDTAVAVAIVCVTAAVGFFVGYLL
jgi:hypothetical protein